MDIDKLRQEFQTKLLSTNEWSLQNFSYCESTGKFHDWMLDAMWKGFLIPAQELKTLRAENASLKDAITIAHMDGYAKAQDKIRELEAENAKLIAERDELNIKAENWNYYQNLLKMNGFSGITDLLTKYRSVERERDALLAEREAMMNQEPAGYIVKDTKNNLEWLTTIQNPEKYKRDYPDFVLTPVYASPLPAQQIPEGYAIEILRKVFDLYESGADCYDSEDHYSAAYLGRCIRLDDDLFKSCVDLLSASQPKGDV